MFDTVKNSLRSNWPERTPTLNIEWGQIDPKGNRRVKKSLVEDISFKILVQMSWHGNWKTKNREKVDNRLWGVLTVQFSWFSCH